MKIESKEVTVRDLTAGYNDGGELGIVAYGGKLDVRPPYQREFVYNDKQRVAVIETITKGFPLNVMYWAVQDDGTFEVIDGQQRTISICQYVTNVFSVGGLYFANLESDVQELILNYALTVYHCSGPASEKLEWFRVINIAGEELTDQELRNATYHGTWVSAAKKLFSKTGCPASKIGSPLLRGVAVRQEYMETAIEWMPGGKDVEGYMALHQHDPNCTPLWLNFQAVVSWVNATFPNYRKEMKGLKWGDLYHKYSGAAWDSGTLESEVERLMADEDVTNAKGIYTYLLSGEERHLNVRAFTDRQKRAAFTRQKGVCVKCKETFTIEQMEPDHITPWCEGGHTSSDNCQMLCTLDNRSKGKS